MGEANRDVEKEIGRLRVRTGGYRYRERRVGDQG